MEIVFCRSCGKQMHDSAITCPHCGGLQSVSAQNTHINALPEGIKGWSWGAFMLSWIWAIGNRTWIGLFALIPIVGFFMKILLGIKGREWAWKNKKWDSVEHFNKVQKKWSYWGVMYLIAILILGGLGVFWEVRNGQELIKTAKQREAARQQEAAMPSTDLNEEHLSESVRSILMSSVAEANKSVPTSSFKDPQEAETWLESMSQRLVHAFPDAEKRQDFLITVHYEATRAGLDPQMVLSLIQVGSNFNKDAVSSTSARGYMQVMPVWVKLIGNKDHNLFHLRTNLRYGCTILRHYVDIENGNLYRALGRYNGSLGQPEYPNLVLGAWKNSWAYAHGRADK